MTKYEKNKDEDLTDPLQKRGIKGDILAGRYFFAEPPLCRTLSYLPQKTLPEKYLPQRTQRTQRNNKSKNALPQISADDADLRTNRSRG